MTSDEHVYTARLELRVRELEQLVAQQGEQLVALVGLSAADSEIVRVERRITALADRVEQLAARFRFLEQTAGQ